MDHEGSNEVTAEELREIASDGGELVVDSGEVANSLVACGFEIKNSSGDGSEFVLQVKAEDEDHGGPGEASRLPQPVPVDLNIEEDSDTFKAPAYDLVLKPELEIQKKFSFVGEEETGSQRTVDGKEQKAFAYASFSLAYPNRFSSLTCRCPWNVQCRTSSPKGSSVQVYLLPREACFGVRECFDEDHRRGHFVYKLEIVASPSDAWKSDCTLDTFRPGESSASVTDSRARGWTGGFTGGAVPSAQANVNNTTTTGSSGKSHGWRASVDRLQLTDKSVTWIWEMKTWANGQKFDAKSAWKSVGTVPKLAVSDPRVVNLTELESELDASWEVPKAVADRLQNNFVWDFHVRVHTTVVRPMLQMYRFLGRIVWFRQKSQTAAPFEFRV